MEYIDPEYNENNKKGSTATKILIASIVLVLIIIMVLLYFIMQLSANRFSAYIDGQAINTSNDLFIIENGKVYVSIRDMAGLLSYSYHSGEYKVDLEDDNKCYVESKDETASFYLNSNKISKVAPGTNNDYENYTISEPVKKVNGKMYILSEGIEIAFNVAFSYDQTKNSIQIATVSNIIQNWTPKIIAAGYELAAQNDFNNNKTVLYGMFIVKKGNNIGVINTEMTEVVVPRYNKIQFVENTKEFFVTNSQNKVGILLQTGNTKISPQYDEIKVLDRESGLYVIKTNNKFGVIDNAGSTIIYPEYEQIGITTSQFPNDVIDNQYLLFNNAIPVKYLNKWGLFNKTGEKILDTVYDSLGCTNSTVKGIATNNVLLIPKYEAIVVGRDKLYGIVNSLGQELVPCALSSIYTTVKSGVEDYYMVYGEQTLDVIEYLDQNVKKSNTSTTQATNTTTQQTTTQTTENTMTQQQTQQQTQSTEQQQYQGDMQQQAQQQQQYGQ